MVEQDVIGHLMDVERLASDLMVDAQKEADKRKSEAKEKAEKLFLSEYEKIITGLESTFEEGKKASDEKRDAEYARYNGHLDSIPLDQKTLNSYLDALCFGK